MENPFKFGTIVEENYFTDRVEEVTYIEQFMKSASIRRSLSVAIRWRWLLPSLSVLSVEPLQ